MKVKLELPDSAKIVRKMGLDRDGDAQKFHTQNVLRRILKYMPFLSGNLIKITIAQTNIQKPEIVTDAPQGGYLFYGKKMVNAVTGKGPALIPGVGYRYRKGTILKKTDIPLSYTKTKNPNAGPRWDRALSAAEGKAMAADLQRYLDRR